MSVETYVQNLPKPKCACTFNGTYLEDVVPGYRTSFVEGRDSYDADLEELTNKTIHGARYRSMKEQTRDLRIHFNLHADNEENYQKRCNAIRGFLLKNRQVRIIFNDELDVYYIGSAKSLQFTNFANYYNSTCIMTIHCATPFKYSVQEFSMEPNADPATDGGTDYTSFVLDYDGTWRAYPTFEVDFYSSDTPDDVNGNCGYVAFTNQNGRILQFGNPEETGSASTTSTSSEKKVNEVLINQTFNKGGVNYGWTANGSNVKYLYTGQTDGDSKAGSTSITTKNFGNSTVLKPSSYGSSRVNYYQGPYLTRVIPNDSNGTAGAVDWLVECNHVFAASSNSSTCSKSRGAFQIVISNNSKVIAAACIRKRGSESKAAVQLYVNGALKTGMGNVMIDCSHNNTNYGFGKNANRVTKIEKNGSSIVFTIAGKTYSYKDESIKNETATVVQMSFLQRQYNERPPVADNVVYSFKFTKKNVVKTAESVDEKSNTYFSTNDKLTVDCENADVYLGKQLEKHDDSETANIGTLTLSLNALGNDWETFYLEPGINQIRASYSDWVTAEHKPTFHIKYRKVYI